MLTGHTLKWDRFRAHNRYAQHWNFFHQRSQKFNPATHKTPGHLTQVVFWVQYFFFFCIHGLRRSKGHMQPVSHTTGSRNRGFGISAPGQTKTHEPLPDLARLDTVNTYTHSLQQHAVTEHFASTTSCHLSETGLQNKKKSVQKPSNPMSILQHSQLPPHHRLSPFGTRSPFTSLWLPPSLPPTNHCITIQEHRYTYYTPSSHSLFSPAFSIPPVIANNHSTYWLPPILLSRLPF